MKAVIKLILFLAVVFASLHGQSYEQTATVISAGGGSTANSGYQNFMVVGENLVSTYMSNSINNGTLGFIFQDDGKIVAPPLKAVLLYPQNNALLSNDPGNPITITFYWIGQQETSFRFQLANNSSFTNTMVDTSVDVNYYSIELPVTGELYWRVLSSKGQLYADWSDIWKFNLLLTDIDEDPVIQTGVYPNPANNEVNIFVPSELVGGRISIMDIIGRVRLVNTPAGVNSIIDISNLETGVYYIKIIKEGLVHYCRFVKN